MKARTSFAVTLIAFIAIVACAPGAGAENVPEGSPSAGGNPIRTFPTSTPWPQFGPPPVTADSITPTVQAAPDVSPTSTSVDGMPVSISGGGGLAAADDSPPVSTVTPVPVGPATPFDDSGTFEPVLQYSYSLPLEWNDLVGDDELVVWHSSRQVHISLRERSVDRNLYSSIEEIARSVEPLAFVDWSERSLSDFRLIDENSYRLEFAGTRLGEPVVAVVDWHLWGEILVEVVTEAEASIWAQDSNRRNTAMLISESMTPDSGMPALTSSEIENQLRVRFNDRASNVFSGPGDGTPGFEYSCRQVLLELLSDPIYVGDGEWQVFVVSGNGAQVWQIFEPDLTIIPAIHNTSAC